MRKTRKLVLHTETLRDLTSSQLRRVVGAKAPQVCAADGPPCNSHEWNCPGYTTPQYGCNASDGGGCEPGLTQGFTCGVTCIPTCAFSCEGTCGGGGSCPPTCGGG